MAITPDERTPTADSPDDDSRWRSSRGRFKIFKAPAIRRRRVIPDDYDTSKIVDGFNIDPLLGDNDEDAVKSKLDRMIRALNPGITETLLFSQRPPHGMSLAHVWFGANLPLFRHSHPAYGDCLYYVLSGEIHMGSQVLSAGDGFFVPNEMPYKYTAGPDGVEVLEFRAGGGVEGAPGMVLHEPSLDSIQHIVDVGYENHEAWLASSPTRISDSRRVECDGEAST